MPKAKKADAEKATKEKAAKPPKAEKVGKGKSAKALGQEPAARTKITAAIKKEKLPAPLESTPKAAPAAKKKAEVAEVVITTDDIALRAYFIAERRQAMGWEGTPEQDWVEAEKQLRAEAKRKARK